MTTDDPNLIPDEPADSTDPGAATPHAASSATAAEPAPAPPPAEGPISGKRWYVIKVTSGREESIKAAIERRVKIEGLEQYFGQIVIPVERVTEIKKVKEKRGDKETTKEKRVIKERKKYPGYIMAEVEFNEQILYLFRETSGVGDFVGGSGPLKPPPPMTDIEVRRMLGDTVPGDEPKKGRKTVVKLDFEKGDKVRIREGAFANMEGEVKEITEPKEAGDTPKVTVEVQIFGRPVPVDLEYWQVDKI
jgi:transcriptional antiterminator NusG